MFGAFISVVDVFPYYIFLLYCIRINVLAQMAGCVFGKSWDLGSIPRSPPFLILFCFPCSYATCIPGVHHTSTIQACHMSQNINPMALIWRIPYASVKCATRIPEKSTRPPINGPDCWQFTSKIGVNTPHWFSFYFSFFLFFLFYLFYLVLF